jgi:hypothetical protein
LGGILLRRILLLLWRVLLLLWRVLRLLWGILLGEGLYCKQAGSHQHRHYQSKFVEAAARFRHLFAPS